MSDLNYIKQRTPIEKLTIAVTLIQSVITDFSDALEQSYTTGYTAAEADFHKQGQMTEIKINLNEFIKVKLTGLGKDIYSHRYNGELFPKIDENGYTRFQLWDFIQLYGEHIGMAFPNVIEPIEIIYEAEAKGEQE